MIIPPGCCETFGKACSGHDLYEGANREDRSCAVHRFVPSRIEFRALWDSARLASISSSRGGSPKASRTTEFVGGKHRVLRGPIQTLRRAVSGPLGYRREVSISGAFTNSSSEMKRSSGRSYSGSMCERPMSVPTSIADDPRPRPGGFSSIGPLDECRSTSCAYAPVQQSVV